jgi:hypothetical protein
MYCSGAQTVRRISCNETLRLLVGLIPGKNRARVQLFQRPRIRVGECVQVTRKV